MTKKTDIPEFPWYAKTAAALLMITLLIYGMIAAKSILIPFMFALFFAVLLSPLCGFFERWKFPRVLAAILSLIIGLAVVLGTLMFFYNQLSGFAEDADMIEERFSTLFDDISEFVAPYTEIDPDEILDNLQSTVVSYVADNFDSLTKGVMSAATTLTMIFIIPVFIVLLLMFRKFLKEFFVRAFSETKEESEKINRLINKVKHVVQHYILGMLIVICILAVLNTTMLMIFGVNHAVFFGVFAAILNIIPFVGPLLGSILPILYALITTDSLLIPILVLLGFYIIQLFESNLFTPTIVGRQVSLNPLVTLLAIFIGAQIWGLAGMILFIPAGAVLKVIFDEVDSLKPLGFLLGKAEYHTENKSTIAKKVKGLSDKLTSKKEPKPSKNKKESQSSEN